MNKKARDEKGITLLMLIVTIIVMMILATVTTKSIKKYKATEIPQELVDHSENTISEADESVENIQNGNWSDIINKKGVEDSAEERMNSTIKNTSD